MSKEYLEALERIKTDIIIETEIRVNKEIGVVNPYYNDYSIVQQALHRLEAIDNANPSEALECLEKIIDNLDDYADFEIKQEANEYIDTIKQALLKAQEPKQYLKWEDLEFKKEEQTMKVLLNGERYLVKYVNEWVCGWCNMVQITNGTYILCTLGNGMKQFFNDLHLERVGE